MMVGALALTTSLVALIAGLSLATLAREVQQLRAAGQADAATAALTNLCQQLLASNEFLYVD